MAIIQTDARDLPLSTSSPSAAAAYRDGIDLLLSAWPGAVEHFDRAIAADPGFALAHAARARACAGRGEMAEARISAALGQRHAADHGTDRERSHADAVALAVEGRIQAALDAALAHLETWPRDAVILSLPLGAFGLFAFSGMADHDQARADLCERHARHYAETDWWFLTFRGWSQAENGALRRGRDLTERAFALRRANANAMHALSHAMFEDGSGGEAAALIEDWLPDYPAEGGLHAHIAWHQALAALDEGDPDRALALYSARIAPPVTKAAAINVVSDGVSLLWRLDAYGHGAPRRLWRDIAAYAEQAYPGATSAFMETHLALLAAATGDEARLDARLASLSARIASGSLPAGPVVIGFGRAAAAFAAGEYPRAAALLEPLAADFARIGGSHAQREVVEDTLLLALMRSGEAVKARAMLDERLHRRPSARDARWRSAIAD